MKCVVADDYRQYADFLERIPRLFSQGEGTVVYQQRNEVRRMEHQGKTFIVKRYKRANPVQQVVYTFFRKTKAERAFLFAQTFRERGIDTPHEIAYLETSEHGLFTVGYFVCEECTWRDAALDLREAEIFDRPLGRAVMEHVALMHSRGVLHGDLNLTNFLYQQREDGGYAFKMIDTNRSRFTEGMPADGECLKNLVRLTHRRDLYEYLMSQYAAIRGWGVEETVAKALQLLDDFENRRYRLVH